MEWIDGNIGSKLTMKYPSVYLVGEGATGEVLSVAYAGHGQHQDAGAKMVHAATNTSSKIVSKSISKDGGKTTYRGLVRVDEGAHGCKSHVQCDALILDEDSVSKTLPYMEVGERDAQIGHEATVSKIADEQIFYLIGRGLSEEQAIGMVVNGFIEPIPRALPDGVRRRVEPPDRASDGGLGRLTAGAEHVRHPVGEARLDRALLRALELEYRRHRDADARPRGRGRCGCAPSGAAR